MTVGEKIKIARKRAGISQQKLGEMVGVTQQAIGKFESGKAKPTLNTLRRISAVLEAADILSLDWDYETEETHGEEFYEMEVDEENSFNKFLISHGANFYSEYSEENFVEYFISFNNNTYRFDYSEWGKIHRYIYDIAKIVIQASGEKQGNLGRGRWQNQNLRQGPWEKQDQEKED